MKSQSSTENCSDALSTVDARHIDQRVDAAELVHDGLDGSFDGFGIADVTDDGVNGVARRCNLLGSLCERGRVPAGDDDRRLPAGKALGNCPANPPARAGNQYYLALHREKFIRHNRPCTTASNSTRTVGIHPSKAALMTKRNLCRRPQRVPVKFLACGANCTQARCQGEETGPTVDQGDSFP